MREFECVAFCVFRVKIVLENRKVRSDEDLNTKTQEEE